jgi:pimeloyl-ACP methyl ester carboxylesterase
MDGLIVAAVVLTLLAAGVLYQWIGTRRHRLQFTPPGPLIDVGGHRLHADCHGRGSPVVLLESGIAASSMSWAVVQPAIAAFTRVCAYDRAGLAWSDVASCRRSFERIVDELSTVIAGVAPGEQYILVGHSFGSFVVRAYAARHPGSVVGLVLVDPPVEWLIPTPDRVRMLRAGRHLSQIGAVLAHLGVVRACLALLTGGAPGAPRRFVRVFGPTTARTLERLIGEVRKLPSDVHPVLQALWCQPKCFHAMADHLQVLERESKSMASAIPPPELPVVVISSGDHPPAQIAAHRALAERSARGRHVIAARSTHWVQFDEPELVVAAVRDLVEESRQRDT